MTKSYSSRRAAYLLTILTFRRRSDDVLYNNDLNTNHVNRKYRQYIILSHAKKYLTQARTQKLPFARKQHTRAHAQQHSVFSVKSRFTKKVLLYGFNGVSSYT